MKDVKAELKKILDTMDIPEMRKNLESQDIRWLSRNIMVRNNNHTEINKALELIRILFFGRK